MELLRSVNFCIIITMLYVMNIPLLLLLNSENIFSRYLYLNKSLRFTFSYFWYTSIQNTVFQSEILAGSANNDGKVPGNFAR